MKNSKNLFDEACNLFPGGVCSPVRAIKPYPFYVQSGEGAHIKDVDDNEFIDYCMAYGPLILGHSHPHIVEAVKYQIEKGSVFGTPTELEVAYAKKITSHFKSIEMLRFVSTGTEATMGAIRLARGFTGRDHIIKIEGGFHGAHDAVLVKAGSGAATMGIPSSSGVPKDLAKNTVVVPFNDIDALENVLDLNEDIACIIMEPIMCNMGPILPKTGYLKDVRKVTRNHDVLLIFDEVITGFRIGISGAQGHYGIEPDITTLGKIVGGGLPLAVFGGRREIMEQLSPAGSVYQSGTFNANPLSLTAGMAALDFIEKNEVYKKVDSFGDELRHIIEDIVQDQQIECSVAGVNSIFQIYFGEKPMDYADAVRCDTRRYSTLWNQLLKDGIFLPPSQFETCFISWAHSKEDLIQTQAAFEKSIKTIT